MFSVLSVRVLIVMIRLIIIIDAMDIIKYNTMVGINAPH